MTKLALSPLDSIILQQPIEFNSIRCARITFADSYLPLMCQERDHQLKLTFTQLQEWKKAAEILSSEPVSQYFYESIVQLQKSIEDLESNLNVNKTYSCSGQWIQASAEQSNIEKEIELLNEINHQIKNNIATTHYLVPLSSMTKKQLKLMNVKIEEWKMIGDRLADAPISQVMPKDIQKIQAYIGNIKEKIDSINALNKVSNYEIADLYFNAKRIQQQLDKLTQLNIRFTEYDTMLAALKPGKEMMMSCYNHLTQTLRNTRYPIQTAPQTYNREDECLRDDIENENSVTACMMIHKVPTGPVMD